MDLFLKIAIVLLVGVFGGRIARLLKLPNVTGYLVFGLFLGPSFLKIITESDIQSMAIVNELALAAIAFSVGSEFIVKDMKKLGKSIIIITLAEVIGAVFLVFSVMYFIFKQDFAFSIILASMSAATAPAATIMVIQQFRAYGPLTRTILPVVALDDVAGIMVFGIALSVAKIVTGVSQYSLWQMLSQPIIEIVGSIILGFVLGFFLTYLAKKASNKEELLALTLATIGGATGLANLLNLSPLLTCIMIGTSLVNLMHNSNRVFSVIQEFISPVYLLFFTLAGASLNIKVLGQVGILGIAYVLARAGGKILGAWLGAKYVEADDAVIKYLGISLLPQGGISIGLSIIVRQQLPQYSNSLITIIMFSVLIYEALGPVFAKIAIQKSGEVNGLDRRRKGKSKKTDSLTSHN